MLLDRIIERLLPFSVIYVLRVFALVLPRPTLFASGWLRWAISFSQQGRPDLAKVCYM